MARAEKLRIRNLTCPVAFLLHLGLSLLSEYYRIFAGMYPAVFLSRVLGLGRARGDVVPAAFSSAIALTPIMLVLEGIAIAAVGFYFWKKGKTK